MTEAIAVALPDAVIGSLSPSRASDFKTCPLLYRFRTIDRLPEAPSRAAVRGTVVHAVLERLFDLPSGQRTLAAAQQLVETYFAIEDPSRLEPAAREERVETVIDGLRLRGYVDRLDISPSGDVRVVDYKTGTIPREAFEAKALFQMKFYALVLWRTRGVVPRQLKLIYLSDRDTLIYTPEQHELIRFERTLKAIWVAIARAAEAGDFRP